MRGPSRRSACAIGIGIALLTSSIAAEAMTRWRWAYEHRLAAGRRWAPVQRWPAARSRTPIHRWVPAHRWRRPRRWSSYAGTNVSPDTMSGWSTGALTARDAAGLRPGQYIWQGTPGKERPVSMIIDLNRQVGYVYQGGVLVGITTVSSGRPHYETPTGTFPILQKAVWHRSTIYSGAPMPYMERLTWSGVALHAGGVPGYRQSHGCIHLPPAFARTLFGVTTLGAIVQVMHGGPALAPAPYQTVAARMPTTAEAVAAMTRSLL